MRFLASERVVTVVAYRRLRRRKSESKIKCTNSVVSGTSVVLQNSGTSLKPVMCVCVDDLWVWVESRSVFFVRVGTSCVVDCRGGCVGKEDWN